MKEERLSRREINQILLRFALSALLLGVPLYFRLGVLIALLLHGLLAYWYWSYSNYLGRLSVEAWLPVFTVCLLVAFLLPAFLTILKAHEKPRPDMGKNRSHQATVTITSPKSGITRAAPDAVLRSPVVVEGLPPLQPAGRAGELSR